VARAELKDGEWELIEPFLPIGRFGPYPERLRQQFEGVVWRFRTGSPWRDMPDTYGAWQTVYHRFLQWRDAGVFQRLMDGMIAEAARRGQVDLTLVSVDSTVARAHHHAAGMSMRAEVLDALTEAATAEKGARVRDESRTAPRTGTGRKPPNGRSGDVSGADAGPG
jgi:transposase